jgi:hypothetical protein
VTHLSYGYNYIHYRFSKTVELVTSGVTQLANILILSLMAKIAVAQKWPWWSHVQEAGCY